MTAPRSCAATLRRAAGAAALATTLALALALAPAARAGVKEFQRAWKDADTPAKKIEALSHLAAGPTARSAETLVVLALDPEQPSEVVKACIEHLATLEGDEANEWIFKQAERAKKWPERAVLVKAIGRRKGDAARAALIEALTDREWQVQAAAIRGLAYHRHKEAVAALIKAYGKLRTSEPEGIRLEGDIRDALFRITGLDQGEHAGWKHWWDERQDTWVASDEEHTLEVEEHFTTTREKPGPILFEEVYSRRVIFVVDTSYSMKIPTGAERSTQHPDGIARFDAMVRELKKVVEDLPKQARFNLITFDDDVKVWAPKLLTASTGNKRKAQRFIDRMRANGATNSYGALEAAFEDPLVDTIIFLSDGYPTAGKTMDFERIIGDVKKWNLVRNVRVHTIAFLAGEGHKMQIEEGDKSLPKDFMRRLAQDNDGRYRLVD